MPDVDPDLRNSISDRDALESKVEDLRKLVDNMTSITKEQMAVAEDEIAALEKDLNEAKEAAGKTRQDIVEAATKAVSSIEDWYQSIAKRTGVDRGDVDFEQKYDEWRPELQDYFSGEVADLLSDVAKLQKSLGESGRKFSESPNLQQKLTQAVVDATIETTRSTDPTVDPGEEEIKPWVKKLVMFISFAWAVGEGIGVYDKENVHKHLMSNPDLRKNIPTGCFQYHWPTGSIRSIGICGVQKICSSETQNSKQTCGTGKGENICSWNGLSCGASTRLTDATSCAPSCTPSSTNPYGAKNECHPKSEPCTKDSECPAGTCVSGQCQYQTCDSKTWTCSPSPTYSPNYPIYDQLVGGKLGFCLGGIPTQPCSVAPIVCTAKNADGTGGACDPCDADDPECTNPNGTYNKNKLCMCVNPAGNSGSKGWATYPMCGTSTELVSWILYMKQLSGNWTPQETPTTTYIIGGLSILLFIITMIWYINYLIKYGKK